MRFEQKGRPSLGDDFYAHVARLYAKQLSKGTRAPVAAVARQLRVSRTVAGAYVHRARLRGLLTYSTRGKKGGLLNPEATKNLARTWEKTVQLESIKSNEGVRDVGEILRRLAATARAVSSTRSRTRRMETRRMHLSAAICATSVVLKKMPEKVATQYACPDGKLRKRKLPWPQRDWNERLKTARRFFKLLENEPEIRSCIVDLLLSAKAGAVFGGAPPRGRRISDKPTIKRRLRLITLEDD